jgi:hypothetical protein
MADSLKFVLRYTRHVGMSLPCGRQRSQHPIFGEPLIMLTPLFRMANMDGLMRSQENGLPFEVMTSRELFAFYD